MGMPSVKANEYILQVSMTALSSLTIFRLILRFISFRPHDIPGADKP